MVKVLRPSGRSEALSSWSVTWRVAGVTVSRVGGWLLNQYSCSTMFLGSGEACCSGIFTKKRVRGDDQLPWSSRKRMVKVLRPSGRSEALSSWSVTWRVAGVTVSRVGGWLLNQYSCSTMFLGSGEACCSGIFTKKRLRGEDQLPWSSLKRSVRIFSPSGRWVASACMLSSNTADGVTACVTFPSVRLLNQNS